LASAEFGIANKKAIAKKFYRINQFIKTEQVRLLDATGKQIGLLATAEALKMAQDQGMDLVEIAGQAIPPVVKIIDFKKFKYLENKKESDSRKSAKQVETKEIRLRPFTSENDLEVRLKRIREWMEEGNRIKVVVQFRGREIAKPEFGHQVISKITEFIHGEGLGKVDRPPKLEGKNLVAMYSPGK
jgi:translation initiation factor IF-3